MRLHFALLFAFMKTQKVEKANFRCFSPKFTVFQYLKTEEVYKMMRDE